MKYYDYWIRYQARNGWLLWFSDGSTEGVYLNSANRFSVFPSADAAEAFAYGNNWNFACGMEKPNDFDVAPRWNNGVLENLACADLVDSWNLIEDLQKSLKIAYDKSSPDNISAYEKLLAGCNLPALNQSGKIYKPQFTDAEIIEILKKLATGTKLMDDYLDWK